MEVEDGTETVDESLVTQERPRFDMLDRYRVRLPPGLLQSLAVDFVKHRMPEFDMEHGVIATWVATDDGPTLVLVRMVDSA